MEIQDQNVYVVSEDPAKVQDSTTLSSEPGLNFTTDSKAVLTKVHLGGADKVDKQKKFGVVEEDNLEQLRPFLPTLPQLFIFLVWTEFLINFVRFIAICTVDSLSVAYTSTTGEMTAVKVRNGFLATGQEWFQITSWVIFLLATVIFFIAMFFLKQNNFKTAATSTLLYFVTFMSLFEAPLTTSYFSRAFQATFTFFRGILVVFIVAIYAQLYKQEIAPPQDHIPSRAPTVALPVPTIPRLFAMLSLTQVAVNFFRFVAIGDEKSGYAFLAPAENWFQVGSWIVFLLMNMVSLTYMFYLHQQIKPAVTETLFFSFTFLALFEAPLTTSSSSRDYQATFTFFRGICILLISGMYAVVHRQEIVPLPSFGLRDGPRKEGENGGTDQKL